MTPGATDPNACPGCGAPLEPVEPIGEAYFCAPCDLVWYMDVPDEIYHSLEAMAARDGARDAGDMLGRLVRLEEVREGRGP